MWSGICLIGRFLLLLVSGHVRSDTGVASTFFPRERLNDGILACDGGRRWTDERELLVAHRSLPCGTVVVIENMRTGALVAARVLDRGPYGAVLDGQWRVKIRARDPGTWRGILDMSPEVAKRVGISHGKIRLWWMSPPLKRPRGSQI